MPTTRRLLRKEITHSYAKEDDTNVLHQLTYWDQREKFFKLLYEKRNLIAAAVTHHLGLNSKVTCQIAEMKDWLHGSFNVCIPIIIYGSRKYAGKWMMIRFPLPYRVGEAFRPGNADEKLRTEAGAYAWLQENCPSVPIPHLYGFALSTGQTFTALENLPFVSRYVQHLRRRILTSRGCPAPSRYIRHDRPHGQVQDGLGVGYLLIEHIKKTQGIMLSCTWEEGRHNRDLRKNLFHSLSRILLALSRVPLPRIGSFTIDDDRFLSLRNRPLSDEIQGLENEQIPVDIPRDFTYSTVESYVSDILAFHDSRLYHQPNAIADKEDGFYQMAALAAMKMISCQFFRRDLRRGPFMFCLTDLHQSNIFVDKYWNVNYLVDLEWASSRPIEMVHPPYWLTSQPVDEIEFDSYKELHDEFIVALEEEENRFSAAGQGTTLLLAVLKRGLNMGTFWYSLALTSPTALFSLFYDHIQPRFARSHKEDPAFYRINVSYWSTNVSRFLEAKLKDKEQYDIRLQEAFKD